MWSYVRRRHGGGNESDICFYVDGRSATFESGTEIGGGERSWSKFLVITNLTHFFTYLFISRLYMFWASQRSSSGDRIVLIYHLVWLVCVTAWYAGQEFPPHWHTKQSQRLIIPDDVLIQFDLLMMSAVMLETCRHMK